MNKFEDFKKRKKSLEIAVNQLKSIVQENMEGAEIEKLDAFSKELQDEISFNVLCVGDFSSGKTTFINKFLLNQDLLPARAQPTTTRLTEIRHGAELIAYVIDSKGEVHKLSGTVKDALGDYVASKGNYVDTTEKVVIEVPSSVLAEGIVVIDAPGLNDPDVERMKVTYDYLHQADAILYFFNAQQAWTKSQKEFLEESILGKSEMDKLFFMLNYWDCINNEEREELLKYVHQEMRKSVDVVAQKAGTTVPEPELLPVSAKTEENFDRVGEVLWGYLTESKGQNVLAYKIQRFNNFIASYIALVDERIKLCKEDSQVLIQKKEQMEQEVEKYKKQSQAILKKLKSRLSIEFNAFIESMEEPFEKFIREFRFGVEKEIQSNRDVKESARKMNRLCSHAQQILSSDLQKKESRFRQKLISVIEDQKAAMNIPLSRMIALDEYFSGWESSFHADAKMDTALQVAGIAGAGASGLGTAGSIVAGISQWHNVSMAQAGTGVIYKLITWWYGSQISKIPIGISTSTISIGLSSGIGMVACLGFLAWQKKHKSVKKEQKLDEIMDEVASQVYLYKSNFINTLNELQSDYIDEICRNVDADVIAAYKQKIEELNAITNHDNALDQATELKQKLMKLKMQVN